MRKFVNYSEAMQSLRLSIHVNQLQRRIQTYPQHFVEIAGEAYISEEYFNALQMYQTAQVRLNALKTGGRQ